MDVENNCLELTDEQFKKLPTSQKLDVLYMNVRAISSIKRLQRMQWISIGAITSAMAWMFLELWNHIKG